MIKKEQLMNLNGKLSLLDNLQDQLKEKKEAFEKENEVLISDIISTKETIVSTKEDLSADAIAEFKETEQKKLTGGLGIRVSEKLIYDHEEAFQWGVNHAMALSLDKKAFEKIAKADRSNMSFVSVEEKLTVTFPAKIVIEEEE